MAIEVKIEMSHNARNQDVSVSDIEGKIQDELNLHYEVVEDVRFGLGKRAGALFLELDGDARFRIGDHTAELGLEKFVTQAVDYAEEFGYADNISSPHYAISEA